MRKVIITEEQDRVFKSGFLSVLSGAECDDVYVPLNNRKVAKKLLTNGFDDICGKFSNDITSISNDRIINKLNKIIFEIQDIERGIRPQLEQLCFNTVVELLDIPDGLMTFDIQLKDSIDPKHTFNISPSEDSDDIIYDSVEQIDNEASEVEKRKMVNIIVQGVTQYLYDKAVKYYINELRNMDSKLSYLYDMFISVNNYLLYTNDVKITDNNHMQSGYVEVNIGNGDDRLTNIKVVATTFPVLLYETIKGLMEVVAAVGLPDDRKEATTILSRADTLEQEPWNMRFGLPFLNLMLGDDEIEPNLIPPFLQELFLAPSKDFTELMNEILHRTNLGKRIVDGLIDKVTKEYKYQRFEDDLMKKRTEKQVLGEVEFDVE